MKPLRVGYFCIIPTLWLKKPVITGYFASIIEDIELLKLLIPYAYDMNRSAIRPDVRLRHAWYIEHKDILGSCPDYLLFEALTPVRRGDKMEPSTAWSDYEDTVGLPETLLERVDNIVDLANR